MKVLLINYEFPPVGGGAATATAELAREMHRLGHAVTVLTAGLTPVHGESIESGVTIRRLRCPRARADRATLFEMGWFVVRAAIALPRILRRARPDGCIVFFSMPCGPLGKLAHSLGDIPYIVSLRGGDVPGTEAGLDRINRWLAPLRRWVLRCATAVVANSAGLKALSEKADPIPVSVIPNGVDTLAFAPRTEPRQGIFRFLFVGRLAQQKNVALLLAAAQLLRSLSGLPFVVTVVGDGPLADELFACSRRLGLGEILEWRQWIARREMPACYAAADCLVNPSRYEGMPNAVLEAMACGLPVIVSDVAGNADLVECGVNGLVFRDNDERALAAAMRRMLEDRSAGADFGRAGRVIVERRHSWDGMARAYIALLNPIAGNGDAAAI